VETIVVHWFIPPGHEGEMTGARLSPEATPGFVDEALFREVDQSDDVVRFVSIGHWETREAFHQRFPFAQLDSRAVAGARVETIVVQWFIRPGREDQMKRPRLSPDDTPGFVDEALFREVDQSDDVVRFVSIGHWETREAFYQRFPFARPREPQRVEDYEAAPRMRGWLEALPKSVATRPR
jgi:heme-degrading monooxygenase HmoA